MEFIKKRSVVDLFIQAMKNMECLDEVIKPAEVYRKEATTVEIVMTFCEGFRVGSTFRKKIVV